MKMNAFIAHLKSQLHKFSTIYSTKSTFLTLRESNRPKTFANFCEKNLISNSH